MRSQLVLVFCLVAGFQGLAQTAGVLPQGLPKDPRAVFAAAAPFYDFSDPTLKPWHLKATYQLYDDKGNPSEEGIFEYWWASPQVFRETWSRPSVTHTDWYMANGDLAYEGAGEPLKLFEELLPKLLLAPLSGLRDLDPAKYRVVDEVVAASGAIGSCLTLEPLTVQQESPSLPDQGPFPTYCFDQRSQRLLSLYSFERVTTDFADIVQTQGKFLARTFDVREGKRKILFVRVDEMDMISPSDPALVPSQTATRTQIDNRESSAIKEIKNSKEVAVGFLIKKVEPIYPADAKKARIQGTVIVMATIGTDGRTHNLLVVSAPSAALAASSFFAVSQWEYKPYLLNGLPVAVETTIKVTFALGR
jgi:TonB family protein